MKVGGSITGKTAGSENGLAGWQIRCVKCDFIEPWETARVRFKAGGKKIVFGRCSRCKRVRFHVIEKIPVGPLD